MLRIPRPKKVTPTHLSDLASAISAVLTGDDLTVTGVSLASSRVQPGDLYAALPGANRHGIEFLGEAVNLGAVAVLTNPAGADIAKAQGLPCLVVDDPRSTVGPLAAAVYGHPTQHLSIIGITGTSGKTSTAYLVDSALRLMGRTSGLIGTVETRIGDETLVSERTTPEAPELQGLFAYAVEQGVTDLVMEVSSHALALHRATGIRFAAAGYTMFGLDHLDFHHNVDEYFAAKAMLFDGRADVEVLNIDDPRVETLRSTSSITYSVDGADATWTASNISGHGFDQTFTVTAPDGACYEGSVKLPGRHNVANSLLAYALLDAVGVKAADAIAGVSTCSGIPGRMELVSGDGPIRGVVDYAHKPDAVTAVLKALRDITPGRLIAIIGAGGDRDAGKRRVMGQAAAVGADLVIVTDDNPRTEDPAAIRAEILTGVGDSPVREVAGRAEAIKEGAAVARPGDTIALLGKGHETGQELADRIVPFDDRQLLAEALRLVP